MKRPNLSRTPLLDTRPVVVAGIGLGILGLALTAVSVIGFVHARGEEELLKARLTKVEQRREVVEGEVRRLDTRLSAVQWKQLAGEVETYQGVVDQRSLVWSELLADLERIAPREIRLTRRAPRPAADRATFSGSTSYTCRGGTRERAWRVVPVVVGVGGAGRPGHRQRRVAVRLPRCRGGRDVVHGA